MYNVTKKKALVLYSYSFNSPTIRYKEASLWNFLQKRRRGSITVEGAVVCSLAIVFIGAFLYFFRILQTDYELKQKMYLYQNQAAIWGQDENKVSEYEDYEMISMFGIRKKIVISNCLKNYGFGGYNPELEITNTYVYVTRYGTVYHRSASCSHLNIKVLVVALQDICDKRNVSGGKYYPCDYCGSEFLERVCYITEYGDKYHSKKSCNSLLRYVKKVLIDEVEHMEECKDCGGQ